MNTLTRAETTALLGDTTAADLRAHWRTLMASPRRHSLSAAHHLLVQKSQLLVALRRLVRGSRLTA